MSRNSEVPVTLEEWLSYLEKQHPSAMELGLDRVLVVFRRLLPMHWRPRVITVAGTNGKGSTVRWLERMLSFHGCSTGAYLSPHIERFNERILIGGHEVSDASLVEAFAAVDQARGLTSLTYFEFATLAALWLFHRESVQDLVLEVGLGGRLDAVNIMDPSLAVITSIGLDHTEWLGNDRNSIGFEKAGILRPGIEAIYGEPDPPQSVLQQAAAQDVRLWRWGEDFAREEGGPLALQDRDGRFFSLPWPQADAPSSSLVVALQALCLLGLRPDEALLAHLGQCPALPGRFETLLDDPTLIADVGHNPHAAAWLAKELSRRFPGRPVRAVYAALMDKDAPGVVEALNESVSHWYLAGLQGPRGRSGEQLAEALSVPLEAHRFQVAETVPQALDEAMGDAAPDDLLLVFGSFLTVAAARDWLSRRRLSQP
ncbi:MAG: bifunctional tetrahydrofolate synthase/dihydrofolate synthase [Oleiphilaceae bacterium]|nr:bifunctional tetrahydrofolate synthase/dihydrofolate synthase [Oleiphilaceae bacterium]